MKAKKYYEISMGHPENSSDGTKPEKPMEKKLMKRSRKSG